MDARRSGRRGGASSGRGVGRSARGGHRKRALEADPAEVRRCAAEAAQRRADAAAQLQAEAARCQEREERAKRAAAEVAREAEIAQQNAAYQEGLANVSAKTEAHVSAETLAAQGAYEENLRQETRARKTTIAQQNASLHNALETAGPKVDAPK